MIHLLIDTCSLLTMANSYGYNNYVKKLGDYINDGTIQLYVHKIGLQEWQKNATGDFDKKVAKLKKNAVNPIAITRDHLEAQYAAITDLLIKAKEITTPGKIKDLAGERIEQRLAPFHKKLNSLNDWYIFGSFAQHCVAEGITSMYFLSKNSNEFSTVPLSDQDDDKNAEIHDQLADIFTSLKINYFTKLNTFLSVVASDIGQLIVPKSFFNRRIEWGLTAKKTILESFDYLFNGAFRQCGFVPIDVLIKFYPFKNSNLRQISYRDGVIFGVSTELEAFFKNITAKEDYSIDIADSSLLGDNTNGEELVKEIVYRLWQNLIFGVSVSRVSEIVYITPEKGILPDVRTDVFKFKYIDGFKRLSVNEELSGDLEVAYSNFKLGNLLTAYRQYTTLAHESAKKGEWFKYFTCVFNLKQVANYLRFPLLNVKGEIEGEELDRSKSVDLYEIAYSHRNTFEYQIMLFIASNEFFTEPYEIIADGYSKLSAKLSSSTIPIHSHSSETYDLFTEFRKVETFLECNYFIYNDYSDFIKLFEYVINGLFIANALHQNYQGQIRELDDEWIEKIIKYGRRKSLLQSWIRCKRKPITYKRTDYSGDDFISIGKRILLLENGDDFYLRIDKESDFFYGTYQHLVENVLVLSSILNLDTSQIEEISKILRIALTTNNILAKHWIFDVVNDFLQVRIPAMNSMETTLMFKIFSKKGYFYSEKIMATIVEKYVGRRRLGVSKRLLRSLISNQEDVHIMSTFRRKLLVVSLLTHVGKSLADFIMGLISEKVEQDEQFDSEVFSIAVAMDVIEVSSDDVLFAARSILPKIDLIMQKD